MNEILNAYKQVSYGICCNLGYREIIIMSKTLESMGFDNWFKKQLDADKLEKWEIARVVSVHKDSYMVTDGENDIFAEVTGKLMYSVESTEDMPTTGDWVYVEFYDEHSHAIIHDVLKRKSILKRKSSGRKIDFQLIAANINTAFIIQSLNYNFNLRRLERYLVMVNESGIVPVVLLSKSDLVSKAETERALDSVQLISPETEIIAFSNETGEHLANIHNLLQPGGTYCLLGSSGVGKTTLLNSLIGEERYDTKTVSKIDSKGRHTTTSRELIKLKNGALLIDTPGMRELGNMSVSSGIDETFTEISRLSESCQFSDCQHINEKGCAILSAIDNDELSEERYKNYIKMKNESAFNEMSYLDRKKKDKKLAKLIKKTLKNKR